MNFAEQHIFGIPPGVDFPKALVDGLCSEYKNQPPHALAKVHLILNTERMLRRVKKLFCQKFGILHPKLHLVTNLNDFAEVPIQPQPITKLVSRFELIDLVEKLITMEPDLASRSSLYSLADSLAELIDEMAGEGVELEAISALDVADQSGHWERAKRFISIAQEYLDARETKPDTINLQRKSVLELIKAWQHSPPPSPIIIAGSTGSRGTTIMLMKAVARLPQGVLLLPGFDFDMPLSAWSKLGNPVLVEDHPQARFFKLLGEIGIKFDEVSKWQNELPVCPERNALISLALRPAPVTDTWLDEGPKLPSLENATKDLTILEAPDARREALAIAIRLREASERGEIAALISPDRQLTRQVTAALDRWGITPDDTAGLPLHLSPTGRFLRHVAALLSKDLTAGALLAIMKHPITHSAGHRNLHLLLTRELELFIRLNKLTYLKPADLKNWAVKRSEVEAKFWVDWVCDTFLDKLVKYKCSFKEHFENHSDLVAKIAVGYHPQAITNYGTLWDGKTGAEVKKIWESIQQSASHGGQMRSFDYADIFGNVLADSQFRDPITPNPNILIWGTLEARVQGADLVIIGGLNEGVWPKLPDPDPWLNRTMRKRSGLLLPDRKIGLSAHDFQQAIAAKQVWISRALRSDGAENVPSRWLNRLVNLLYGLKSLNGPEMLERMKYRGEKYLSLIEAIGTIPKSPPATRVSPRPPVWSRPKNLSVTEIKTLIRNPYEIYAKRILNLRALEPLNATADARLKGQVFHKVFERFVEGWSSYEPDQRKRELMKIMDEELQKQVPWSLPRLYWRQKVAELSDKFILEEANRQINSVDGKFEVKGAILLADQNFTLVARADRIHIKNDGTLSIFDYKTGMLPSPTQQRLFDKQLYLTAAIAEGGGFKDIPPSVVSEAAFISLTASNLVRHAPFDEEGVNAAWEKFKKLISSYQSKKQGYTPRRALFKKDDISDYDQLSRFGEWDITKDPTPEDFL